MHFFKIFKNTIYQSVAKFFSSFVGFLITIIIANAYGVLGYGDFIKITSFVAPFYIAVDFGLNAFFLQLKEKQKKYSQLFLLRLYLSIAVFLLVNLINIFLPYNSAENIGYSPVVKFGIFLFSLSVFNQVIILSSLAIFQQKLKYFYYMCSIILGSLVNLLLVFLFVKTTNSILLIIAAFVLSGLVTAVIAHFFTKEKIFFQKLDFAFAKKIIVPSTPLMIMLAFNLVYFRIDAIILTILKSTTDVGIYGLSYKFFDFLIALPLFLSNSLYPLLLKNLKNTRKLKLIIRNYSSVFIFFGVILIFPFWFLSPLFVLIKEEFIESVLPFRILLVSLPLFFISSFFQWILILFRQQKYLMLSYLAATIINIVLNIIFIPKFSYYASAVITSVSEMIIVVLLLIKLIIIKKLLERDVEDG